MSSHGRFWSWSYKFHNLGPCQRRQRMCYISRGTWNDFISFSFHLDSSMIFLSVCMVENTLLHLFWELPPMWESSICVLLFSSVVWWSPPIHFHFMSVLVVLLTHSATSVVTHSLNIQFHHIKCWFARRVMMTKWFCDVGLPKNHSL